MAVQLSELLWSVLDELRYQLVPRRIRAFRGAEPVLDTLGAAVVWEPKRVVPSYAVPVADLLAELQPAPLRSKPVSARPVRLGASTIYDPSTPFTFHTVPGRELTVRVGEHTLVGAAFAPEDPALAEYVILDFDAFDWLEEDEPLVAHPRDPFDRIDVRASRRTVRFEHHGQLIAESNRSLMLFEGVALPPRYYLPRERHRRRAAPQRPVECLRLQGSCRLLVGDRGRGGADRPRLGLSRPAARHAIDRRPSRVVQRAVGRVPRRRPSATADHSLVVMT